MRENAKHGVGAIGVEMISNWLFIAQVLDNPDMCGSPDPCVEIELKTLALLKRTPFLVRYLQQRVRYRLV